jgi:hypothetical protein
MRKQSSQRWALASGSWWHIALLCWLHAVASHAVRERGKPVMRNGVVIRSNYVRHSGQAPPGLLPDHLRPSDPAPLYCRHPDCFRRPLRFSFVLKNTLSFAASSFD